MSKFALPVTLACLLAIVALVRGDEPVVVPLESEPGDAALAATTPADPAESQPESPTAAMDHWQNRGGGLGLVTTTSLPESAIPGKRWVAGNNFIVALSDDGKQLYAYSEQHPHWVSQDLPAMPPWFDAIPVIADIAAVRHGTHCFAYSPTLGKWDALALPNHEAAIPRLGTDSVSVHSPSQGDYVFKNAWGKWFSADEIKTGKVAEFFQTRQAPAAQAFVDPELQIGVFQLENIDATDAARIVRQLYGEAINPVVDERTNSLVCKDAPSVLAEVEALLLQLDSTETKATDLPAPAQSVDDLRKLYGELEQRTQELAAKLRHPAQNSATVKQSEAELRETVRKAFEARQKLQRAEHAEFAQRLQAVRQSIETRERISQQIIDRRVDELLDPNLKWDSFESREMAPTFFGQPHSPAPLINVQPLPDEVECWELFGAKFRPVDEIAGVQLPRGSLIEDSRGLQIVEVRPNSPAENSQLREGDIIVRIGLRHVTQLRDVNDAWRETRELYEPVMFVRGKEVLHARIRWANIPTTSPDPVGDQSPPAADHRQTALDTEREELLSLRKDIRLQLVELESAKLDEAEDGNDIRQAEEKKRNNARIAALKSKLEEIDERLRVLAKQQAILQDQSDVPPGSIPDSDQTYIQRATELRKTIAALVEEVAIGEAVIKHNPQHDDIGGITKRLETARRDLLVHRDELAARIQLLELQLNDAQSAADFTAKELERLTRVNKATPNTIAPEKLDQARRDLETAQLRVESIGALLELYRKVDPSNEQHDARDSAGEQSSAPTAAVRGTNDTLNVLGDGVEGISESRPSLRLS